MATTYVLTLRQAQEGPVVHLTPGDLAFEAFVVHGAPGQHLLGQRGFCETGGGVAKVYLLLASTFASTLLFFLYK